MIYLLQADMPGVNWIALLIAAISSLVIGFIYYHPKVLGKFWQKHTGLSDEQIQKGNMPLIFGTSLIMAFVACYYLNMMGGFHGEDEQTFSHGFLHGVLFIAFLVAPVVVTISMYERKKFGYIAVTLGYWILTFGTMSGILFAWR